MDPLVKKRPDGHDQKFCAMLCAGAAFILFVFALMLPLERYGEVIARNVVARFWMLVVAGGLLQIALLCALTAIIVKAMWYLPGREIQADPIPTDQARSPAATPPHVAAGSAAARPTDGGNGALIFGVLSIFIMVAFVFLISLFAR
jgi:hypothetical protein